MNDPSELAERIDQAKRRLALPALMKQLGHAAHVNLRGNARCPFHSPDKRPSFAIMEKDDGAWHWSCFAFCGSGDEIDYLAKAKGLTNAEATKQFLEMAGFPSHPPAECPGCRESPKSHTFPEYPVSLASPVSNGQGLEKELKDLAARCACASADDQAGKRRFKLARDVRAVEKRTGRELTTAEVVQALDKWYRLSQPLLPADETRDDHLAMFLAELGKVRVPTGETIKKALEYVLALSVSELPVIPEYPGAPENWRRLAALHRELSRRSANKTYFLGCRDAAKAVPGLSHQKAYYINLALAPLGVVKIVRIGDKRPNGKASEFRYLLPQAENGAPQAENESHGSEADDYPF